MTYKVLLNDGMDQEGIEIFEKAGIEVNTTSRDENQLLEDIVDFDALTVRSATKVPKEVIIAGAKGRLKVIGRAGVGFDNIDAIAAAKNGILVKYAPNGNTNATAELAITLMLSVSRNIPQAHYTIKNGVWQKKPFKGHELSHKTLGIIGCGRIGQRLSELVRGFDIEVIGYEKELDYAKKNFPNSRIKYVSKEELFDRSDYISLHTGGKYVIIGEAELVQMNPTAYLINASRGGNVDENSLYHALSTGMIAGAGLDSYNGEPKKENAEIPESMKRLAKLDNVVMSTHLGASTKEAQIKTSQEMATVIRDYLLKGDFSNAVNAGETVEAEERKTYSVFVTHADQPGAFAQINQVFADYNVNIRETPSRQLNGSATSVYLLHQQPSNKVMVALNQLEIVQNARL